ncbi:MAG TPA: hypothetical protein VFN10_02160 [Thermoanaerobaculia bacterium]|nr:hypothetical protein [Thermoanaerobaculia bacterium]
MTHWHRMRRLLIAAASFFAITARAHAACPPTPDKYRDLAFGGARFAIEEDCRSTFTQNEQFFLAGVTHVLRTTCKPPRDEQGRALMERFTKAAALSLDLQKRQDPLAGRVPSPTEGATAFAAGTAMMEDIPCNGPEAALLARGIVIYLKRTSGTSRFVAGCREFYAGRYDEKECRCVADALRRSLPDVDQRFFDRKLVKESIHQSPRIALTLIGSCGVWEY